MARIPPPSLLLLPLLLLALVSWAPPAAEGALLQPHNRPQWLMGAEDAAFEEQAPFEVRLRRSPQSSGSGDADQSGETNVFKRMMNRVKSWAKKINGVVADIMEAFGLFGKQSGSSAKENLDSNAAAGNTVAKPDRLQNDTP